MDAKWLKEKFAQTGRSQSDLARHLKKLPSTVNKMVNGKRQIKSPEADEILKWFASPVKNVTSSAEMNMQLASDGINMSEVNRWPNDIIVYGTALGGTAGGDFTMSGDSGIRVRRPPRLEGRVDIIALFVRGDSMEPRYRQGDLIYLERGRPPQINDYVVIETPGINDERPACIRQLISFSGPKVKVRQHNPERTYDIERTSILHMLRIMTLQDILG